MSSIPESSRRFKFLDIACQGRFVIRIDSAQGVTMPDLPNLSPHIETAKSRLTVSLPLWVWVTLALCLILAFGLFGHHSTQSAPNYDNLVWMATDNGTDVNWKEANAYCTVRSSEGKSFRLPNRSELQSAWDEKHASFVKNIVISREAAHLWTSTRTAKDGSPGGDYVATLFHQPIEGYGLDVSYDPVESREYHRVLCVR